MLACFSIDKKSWCNHMKYRQNARQRMAILQVIEDKNL